MPPSVTHRTVLTCSHVIQGSPILRVSRDRREGIWRFLCGCRSHRGDQLWLVSRRVMMARDGSLPTLDGMPSGATADRAPGDAGWRPRPAGTSGRSTRA